MNSFEKQMIAVAMEVMKATTLMNLNVRFKVIIDWTSIVKIKMSSNTINKRKD